MSDPVIGALSVILGGDASALNKMLAGAQNSVSSFAKNVTAIASGMGLEKAIEGAIASITGQIKQALADADALSKMSESTGVAVDTLSKLKYAGDVTGVSLDTLGKALGSLSKDMADVAAGGVTPATAAFAALGISVKNSDGTMKNAADVLGDIAEKFAGYKDGAAKAALAQAIFGDGGAAMIPLLNKGRDGLAALGDEAAKLGLVLDSKTQFAVQSLNANLAKMDAIKQGLVATVTAKLLPAFEQISVVMLQAKENSTLMSNVADGLTTALKGAVSMALQGILAFSRLAAELNALKAWGDAPMFSAESTAAWAAYLAEGEKTKQMFSDLDKAMATIGKDGSLAWDAQIFDVKFMQSEVAKLALTWTQVQAPIAAATDSTHNALQMFLDTTAKRSAATVAEAQTVGMATDAQAKLRVELEAQAISTAKNIPINEAYRKSIDDAAAASAAAAQKLAGAKLTQDNLAPEEQRNQLLAQYNTLLQNGTISLATFEAATQKVQFPQFAAASRAALDFNTQLDALANTAINGLASGLAAIVTGTKTAAQAFKDFAVQVITQLVAMIVKAVIFKAIMTALGFSDGGAPVGGTGFNLIGPSGTYDTGGFTGPGGKLEVAGVVHRGEDVFSQDDVARWGGIGNVEKLRLGGPNALPTFSGGGAVDEQISGAAVMAAPSGTQRHEIDVTGLGNDFYSRASVIKILDGINSALGNGYKLKLAA